MFKLFKLKRYGYVDYGYFPSVEEALVELNKHTKVRTAGINRYFCEDGHTWEIKYA